MVRSRELSMDIFEKFARLPVAERRIIADAPNRSYQERYTANEGRNVWTERGFMLPELATTSIPDTVAARGWEQYTRTPGRYHPELVREFYAAMVPEVFHAQDFVWVRGCRVRITIQGINEFLHTPYLPDLAIFDGMPRHEFFREQLDGRVSAALRRNGSSVWNRPEDFRSADLFPDIAMWGIFVKHSLMPSSHRTVVGPEVAHILFAIQNNLEFDVGRIIFSQILDTGRTHGVLTFPCLITHFCRIAGVPGANDEPNLHAPTTDINRKVYNLFCQSHGLEKIPTGRPRRNRHRAAAEPEVQVVADEQAEEEAAEVAVPPSPHSPPHEPHESSGLDAPPWAVRIIELEEANGVRIRALQDDLVAFEARQETRHAELVATQTHLSRRVDEIFHHLEYRHSGRIYTRGPRNVIFDPSEQQ